ncbi:MAG: hypothetical protein AAF581_06580 [Planctomycetota bacterium]
MTKYPRPGKQDLHLYVDSWLERFQPDFEDCDISQRLHEYVDTLPPTATAEAVHKHGIALLAAYLAAPKVAAPPYTDVDDGVFLVNRDEIESIIDQEVRKRVPLKFDPQGCSLEARKGVLRAFRSMRHPSCGYSMVHPEKPLIRNLPATTRWIARARVVDWLRQQYRRPPTVALEAAALLGAMDKTLPVDLLDSAVERGYITELQREILWRRHILLQKNKDIAIDLGYTPPYICQQHKKALEGMRRFLRDRK